MYRYFSLFCIASALLSVAVCCEPVEIMPQVASSQTPFLVDVSTSPGNSTKSSMSVSEDDIQDINIYAYRGGMLEAEAYGKGTSVSLELFPDKEYTIYALANAGEVHAPALESQLGQMSITPDKMAMCCREGRTKTFTNSDRSLQLELSRLYAKYVLKLDNALQNCSYTVSSVEVINEADAVSPFSGASVASATSAGDHASTEDLSSLNSGEEVCFYVLENCQGTLLPGNADPWEKCPENLPSDKRDLCTYLHIEGTWETEGAVADMSINLMLGADNCTDFNVVRNTAVSITLSLEDSGTLKSNWKVVLDSLEDERNLSFTSSKATVMQEDGWVAVPLNVQPSNMTFYAKVSSPEVFAAKVENGKVYVKGLYDGDKRPEATLEVSSWDYRHRASVDLTLDYNYTPIPELDVDLPEYYGEYACVSLPESGDDTPVVVETAAHKAVFAPSGKTGWEKWLDGEVEYYAMYDDNMLVFRPVGSVSSSLLSITRYKSRNSYHVTGTLPTLSMDDALVSETGNREYDEGLELFYDSKSSLSLCAEDGSKLNMCTFEIPPVLISRGVLSVSDSYEAFRSLYPGPSFSASEDSVMDYVERGYGVQGGDYFLENDNLATLYLYGTGDYAEGGGQYGLKAEIPLACGETLVANSVIEAIEAFPDQRYLGNVFNYQLAPAPLRSNKAAIDFSSGGKYHTPSVRNTLWSVRHLSSSSDHLSPKSAYEESESDDYSRAASMYGHDLSFEDMNSYTYPSCGAMALMGTAVNPHTRKSFCGYYTFDLVLYLSIGCYVKFPAESGGKLRIGFTPFTEYSEDSFWRSHFPSEIKVKSRYDNNLYKISMSGNNTIGETFAVSGYEPASSLESAVSQLEGNDSLFDFDFDFSSSSSSTTPLKSIGLIGDLMGKDDVSFDRNGILNPSLKSLQKGSYGYYYLVKQSTHPCFDYGDKYNGLENYIIEAAYEDISL